MYDFINSLIDKYLSVFRPLLIAQVVFSTAMICVTAAGASLNLDNFVDCMKFVSCFIAVLFQTLLWCYVGNKVYVGVSIHFNF